MCPLQPHPAQDALFGDGTNAHSVAGAQQAPFCRFKKQCVLKVSDTLAPELPIKYLEEE